MVDFLKQHWAYILGALLVHAVFAAIFGLTMLNMQRNAPPVQLAIQAVIVDPKTLNDAARQQRQQRDRDRAQQQQRDQQAQREREREAQEREQQALREKEQVAEQQRREQQEVQREEAERRKAAEAKRLQEAAESDLQRQLQEEEANAAADAAAASSPEMAQYQAMIRQAVERRWNRPLSARDDLRCQVTVRQTSAGVVLSAKVGTCNGDAAVKQSVENAVVSASPLPTPSNPRLWKAELTFIFVPGGG